jgi:hypothetical protein
VPFSCRKLTRGVARSFKQLRRLALSDCNKIATWRAGCGCVSLRLCTCAMPRKAEDSKQPRAGRPATRRVLERPPDPDDAATPDDEAYIDARAAGTAARAEPVMPHEPLIWLSREERRAMARGRQDGGLSPNGRSAVSQQSRRCPYCTARLANGAAVCSEVCDQGWWRVVPTISGELYEEKKGVPPKATPSPSGRCQGCPYGWRRGVANWGESACAAPDSPSLAVFRKHEIGGCQAERADLLKNTT